MTPREFEQIMKGLRAIAERMDVLAVHLADVIERQHGDAAVLAEIRKELLPSVVPEPRPVPMPARRRGR